MEFIQHYFEEGHSYLHMQTQTDFLHRNKSHKNKNKKTNKKNSTVNEHAQP